MPYSPIVKPSTPGSVPGIGVHSIGELPPKTCEKAIDNGGGPREKREVEDFIGVELP